MAWYEDLARCDYFDRRHKGAALLATGWLGRGHAFETGSVDAEDFDRLVDLLVQPWQPCFFLGYHDCELCNEADGPHSFEHDGRRIDIGTSNLFVPTPGLDVLVAPSMVIHYIQAHDYRPPEVFLQAVRECPPMGSRAYFRAIRGGVEGLVRGDFPG